MPAPPAPAAAASTTASGPSVSCSQDALFFPLPISGGIENIIQLTNRESRKVAYKVRSTIRQRYAVKPTIGFLHPKEAAIVKFLLDPVTMEVDGQSPDEQTRDAFLIDFAFVEDDERSGNGGGGAGGRSGGGDAAAAAAFWKTYSSSSGAVPPGGVHRKRLPCMYTKGDKVPKSLTVHINNNTAAAPGDNNTATASSPALQHGTAATPRSNTHFSSGQRSRVSFDTADQPLPVAVSATPPPLTTPASSKGGPTQPAASTPLPPASAATGERPKSTTQPDEGATSVSKIVASSTAAFPQAPPTTATPSTGGIGSSTAAENFVGPVVRHEPFLRAFLFYRVPLAAVVVLLLLSFFAALVEDSTAFSMLL